MRLAARTMARALITDAEAARMKLRRVISEITKQPSTREEGWRDSAMLPSLTATSHLRGDHLAAEWQVGEGRQPSSGCREEDTAPAAEINWCRGSPIRHPSMVSQYRESWMVEMMIAVQACSESATLAEPRFHEPWPAWIRRYALGTAYALRASRIGLLPRLALATAMHLVNRGRGRSSLCGCNPIGRAESDARRRMHSQALELCCPSSASRNARGRCRTDNGPQLFHRAACAPRAQAPRSAVRSLDPFGHLLDGRAFARARTAAHTGRSLLSTAHPHPRRYRCPNPGHPSGRAVARNTAPCGNGPRGRRRASCGRPWRLDLPDRRWQRQRAKRQVTSTTWPLRNRLCTNFQGRARQQLPAQTAFYPCYLLPETCWEQCPALLEGSLPTRQAIGQARQHRITQGGLFFDDLHGKPGELCSVPDVPALLGTAIPDGGARGSAYL
jgi:hypothetical protein